MKHLERYISGKFVASSNYHGITGSVSVLSMGLAKFVQ